MLSQVCTRLREFAIAAGRIHAIPEVCPCLSLYNLSQEASQGRHSSGSSLIPGVITNCVAAYRPSGSAKKLLFVRHDTALESGPGGHASLAVICSFISKIAGSSQEKIPGSTVHFET